MIRRPRAAFISKHSARALAVLLLLLLSASPRPLLAQGSKLVFGLFLEQRVVMLMSPWVTIGGYGGGIGLETVWRDHFVAELHADALFAMGRTYAAHVALGVQRAGFWQPGVKAAFSLLLGDRLELLRDDGRRPPVPNWSLGLRVLPLRFAGDAFFASAAEIGVGTDLAKGLLIELSVLKAGARW